jgi:hypothetical protein
VTERPHEPPSQDVARMQHFRALEHDQQLQAIRRLGIAGQSPQTIARATGLSVEAIASLLAEEEIS